MSPTIWHVFDGRRLPWLSRDERSRNANARGTWNLLAVRSAPWKLHPVIQTLPQDQPPTINSILDAGMDAAGDADLLFWCNLDICLVPTTAYRIPLRLQRSACCFGRRVDVADATIKQTDATLLFEPQFEGADWFAMRADWWRKAREQMPPMFIACEAFDGMLAHLMRHTDADAELQPAICWHQRHESRWLSERLTWPANQHNRRQARLWADGNASRTEAVRSAFEA